MQPPSREERISDALAQAMELNDLVHFDAMVLCLRDSAGSMHMQVIAEDAVITDLAARGMLHLYPQERCANG